MRRLYLVNASPPDPKENERDGYGAGRPARISQVRLTQADIEYTSLQADYRKNIDKTFRIPSHLSGLETRTGTGSDEAFRVAGNADRGRGGSKT